MHGVREQRKLRIAGVRIADGASAATAKNLLASHPKGPPAKVARKTQAQAISDLTEAVEKMMSTQIQMQSQ